MRFITVFALHEMREFDEAIEVAERLLADCERDGAIYDQAKALSVLSGLRYLCGDVELAMDNLAAAMFIVRTDVPLDNWAASALVSLANTAMAVELFEVAEEGFRRCVDYGVLSGSVLPLAYGLLNGAINHLQWGMRLELLGHSGDAVQHYRAAQELVLRFEPVTASDQLASSWSEAGRTVQGFIWCVLGEPERGRRILRDVEARGGLGGISENHMVLMLGLLRAEVVIGELDEARRLFTSALDLACHQPSRQWESAVLAERVRLHVRLGDHQGAVNAALSVARHAESALWGERERRLGAVYVRLRLHQLGDERREAERIANEDPLTGLGNRRMLDVALGELVGRSSSEPVSLVFVDVDHFKAINDMLSHQVGDKVLQQLGRLLLRVCRSHDVVVRYGGDEFVLLLRDANGGQAAALGERLRRAVAEHPWYTIHPHLSLTLSIGVAEHRPGASYDDLLPLADAAVYESKREGRDRVSVAG